MFERLLLLIPDLQNSPESQLCSAVFRMPPGASSRASHLMAVVTSIVTSVPEMSRPDKRRRWLKRSEQPSCSSDDNQVQLDFSWEYNSKDRNEKEGRKKGVNGFHKQPENIQYDGTWLPRDEDQEVNGDDEGKLILFEVNDPGSIPGVFPRISLACI